MVEKEIVIVRWVLIPCRHFIWELHCGSPGSILHDEQQELRLEGQVEPDLEEPQRPAQKPSLCPAGGGGWGRCSGRAVRRSSRRGCRPRLTTEIADEICVYTRCLISAGGPVAVN